MRQINLLPDSLRRAEALRTVRNAVLLSLLPAILALAVGHFFLSYWCVRLEREIGQPKAYWGYPQINRLTTEIQLKKNELSSLLKNEQQMFQVYSRHQVLPEVLTLVGNSSRDRISLTQLAANMGEGTLLIRGQAFHTRPVSEFMLRLRKMGCFKDVVLVRMEKDRSNESEWVDFNLKCLLK